MAELLASIDADAAKTTTPEMRQLIEELRSTQERRLVSARQTFNAAVMHYNRLRGGLPNALIANLLDFPPARLLETDSPPRSSLPKKSFA